MATQEQLQIAQNAFKLMGTEKKNEFLTRYESLSDSGKEQAISNLVSEMNKIRRPELTNKPYMQRFGESIASDPGVRFLRSAANTALLGIPQAVLRNISPNIEKNIFPRSRNISEAAAEGIGGVAGIIGGVGVKAGEALASKLLPKVSSGASIGSPLAKRFGANVVRDISDIGRGAITGGVAGVSQISDIKSSIGKQVEQQAVQALGGSLLGAGVSGIGVLSGKLGRKMNKGISLSDRKDPFSFVKSKKRPLNTRIMELKRETRDKAINELDALRNSYDDAKTAIDANIVRLNDKLESSTIEAIPRISDDIIKFNRSISESYGNTLDDIASSATARKANVKINAVNDMFEETLSELEEMGLSDTSVVKKIKSISKKYSLTPEESNILTSSGDHFKKDVDITKQIDFKQLRNDIRGAVEKKSSSMRSSGKYDRNDLAQSILNRNYGNLLLNSDAETARAFSELQSSYAESIGLVKEAYKLFKPGRVDISGGSEKFLKRIGTGKVRSRAESDFAKFLEKGTTIGSKQAEGVRPFTQQLRDIGKQIEAEQSKLSILERSKKMGTQKVRNALRRKIGILENREKKVADIMATQRNVLSGLIKTVENAAIGAGTAYGVSKGIRMLEE